MGALRYLLEKEFKQFLRNSFLPRLAIAFPVMTMLIMPWVTTLDIKNIYVTIVDSDHSTTSQRLISKIGASGYFVLRDVKESYHGALDDVEYGTSDVILEIPRRFERNIVNSEPAPVQISVNAVNGTKGSMGGNYLSAILADFGNELNAESGNTASAPVSISISNLYNPLMNYRWFMIPALMVILLITMCGFLPALNIVSEKEIGTIEQMNVTPVGKFQFILAKLIPYWFIGIVALSLCFVIVWLIYGLVPSGSYLTLYAVSVIFILIMSAIGLIISNYSDTMQQSMFVMFFFVMIFVLMSGLMTPVSSMPVWAQYVSEFIPPRYFVEIMRAVYLKGSGFAELYPKFLALCAFAVGLSLWAILSYRKRS